MSYTQSTQHFGNIQIIGLTSFVFRITLLTLQFMMNLKKIICKLSRFEFQSDATTTQFFVFFATQNSTLIKVIHGKKNLTPTSSYTQYCKYIPCQGLT